MNDKDRLSMELCCFAGLAVTFKEVDGIIKFMDVEKLIDETKNAYLKLKECVSDYWKKESDCSTETKMLMLINGWHSPFEALTELVKRIETNEAQLKRMCKEHGIGFREIGYVKLAKEAREILQKEASRQPKIVLLAKK